MSLTSPDRPLPVPSGNPPEKGKNLFSRGLKKIFGAKTNPHPLVPEQGMTVWQEGEVPMTEVARIMKEQGKEIAKNLYAQYEHSFDLPFDMEGRFEDKLNNVQLFNGRGGRVIKVFIVPPNNKDTGYTLEIQPCVDFRYENTGGSWKYRDALIHKQLGGYVAVSYAGVTEEEEKKHGGQFWDARVKMPDLERALGKYLPKQPNQAFPPSTPSLNSGT